MARSSSCREPGTDSGCLFSPERVDAVVSSRSTKRSRWRSTSSYDYYPCDAFCGSCGVTGRVEQRGFELAQIEKEGVPRRRRRSQSSCRPAKDGCYSGEIYWFRQQQQQVGLEASRHTKTLTYFFPSPSPLHVRVVLFHRPQRKYQEYVCVSLLDHVPILHP